MVQLDGITWPTLHQTPSHECTDSADTSRYHTMMAFSRILHAGHIPGTEWKSAATMTLLQGNHYP
jgi:hypothetical protein